MVGRPLYDINHRYLVTCRRDGYWMVLLGEQGKSAIRCIGVGSGPGVASAERRPDPRDGRAVRIALTDKARSLREPLLAAAQATNADAMAALGLEGGEATLRNLRLLVDHLASTAESDAATALNRRR